MLSAPDRAGRSRCCSLFTRGPAGHIAARRPPPLPPSPGSSPVPSFPPALARRPAPRQRRPLPPLEKSSPARDLPEEEGVSGRKGVWMGGGTWGGGEVTREEGGSGNLSGSARRRCCWCSRIREGRSGCCFFCVCAGGIGAGGGWRRGLIKCLLVWGVRYPRVPLLPQRLQCPRRAVDLCVLPTRQAPGRRRPRFRKQRGAAAYCVLRQGGVAPLWKKGEWFSGPSG